MSRSIVPDILAVLEPYLDARQAAFDALPEADRAPTLPATNDGKVSVDGIVRDLACNPNWCQHFFKKREILEAVNVVAEGMGLAPIGSRAAEDDDAAAVRSRLARVGGAEKKATEDLVEALRRIDALTVENERLRHRAERAEAEIAGIFETGVRPFHDPFSQDEAPS